MNRVSSYREYFDEINIDAFEFTKGLKCSNVHNFDSLNNLSINIVDWSFYHNQHKWKQKLIPIEIIKKESDRMIDF